MGLFALFKNKERVVSYLDTDIVAPVSGEMIPANKISDAIFSEELMGQTIGFVPTSGEIVSPVNGTVEILFPTNHAFAIRSNDGSAYLIHIGIDTVSLNGKGFKAFVKQGDTVKAGQKVVDVDFVQIKQAGLDTTVMLIVTERKEDAFKADYIDYSNVTKGQKINI